MRQIPKRSCSQTYLVRELELLQQYDQSHREPAAIIKEIVRDRILSMPASASPLPRRKRPKPRREPESARPKIYLEPWRLTHNDTNNPSSWSVTRSEYDKRVRHFNNGRYCRMLPAHRRRIVLEVMFTPDIPYKEKVDDRGKAYCIFHLADLKRAVAERRRAAS